MTLPSTRFRGFPADSFAISPEALFRILKIDSLVRAVKRQSHRFHLLQIVLPILEGRGYPQGGLFAGYPYFF